MLLAILVPRVASDEEAEDAGRVNGGTGSLALVEATDIVSSWSATDTAEGDLMAVFLEDMDTVRRDSLWRLCFNSTNADQSGEVPFRLSLGLVGLGIGIGRHEACGMAITACMSTPTPRQTKKIKGEATHTGHSSHLRSGESLKSRRSGESLSPGPIRADFWRSRRCGV